MSTDPQQDFNSYVLPVQLSSALEASEKKLKESEQIKPKKGKKKKRERKVEEYNALELADSESSKLKLASPI